MTIDFVKSSPPRHWRGHDVFCFILAFIFLNIIVLPIVNAIPLKGDSALAIRALIGTFFAELALIGIAAFTVRFVRHQPFFGEIRWSRNYQTNNSRLLWLGVGLAVVVMIVSTVFPPSNPPIEMMLKTPMAIILFGIFGIAFAPILEEIIFRGYLFRLIESIFSSKAAVRSTALMFMMMHVPQLWGSWAGILVILGVGYILSAIRQKTDSVIPCVLVHTTYNGTLFLAYILSTLAYEGVS